MPRGGQILGLQQADSSSSQYRREPTSRQLEVMKRFVVDGQSAEEIGRDLGCAAGTVLTHLRDARLRLRIFERDWKETARMRLIEYGQRDES